VVQNAPPVEVKTDDQDYSGMVWNASEALLLFLQGVILSEQSPAPEAEVEAEQGSGRKKIVPVQGQRVVDVGAGTGLLSMGVARMGCSSVVATDQPEALPLLGQNVEINDLGSSVAIEKLRWEKREHTTALDPPFDVVLCSDCVYNRFYHRFAVYVLKGNWSFGPRLLTNHHTRQITSKNLSPPFRSCYATLRGLGRA
jgi:Lysine methyltransferase